MTRAPSSASQSRAHLAPGRAGPDDARPHAGALQLHLHRVRHALQAPLARRVGGHERPGPHGDVRGDEHDVAAPPLDHARARTRAPARCAPTTARSSSRGEALGVDLVHRRRAPPRRRWRRRPRPAPRAAVDLLRRTPSTEPASVTSSGCTTASPPSSRICSASSSQRSVRRAPSATGKPAAASAERGRRTDAGRGAGDDGGPPLRLLVRLGGHQRTSSRRRDAARSRARSRSRSARSRRGRPRSGGPGGPARRARRGPRAWPGSSRGRSAGRRRS